MGEGANGELGSGRGASTVWEVSRNVSGVFC